jgi:hypothetical protein
MKVIYIKDPYVGQRYHTVHNSTTVVMEIISLDNSKGDDWVGFKNPKSGQEYSCRLEAFLHRYVPIVD